MTATLSSRQVFIDDHGETWIFRTLYTEGGMDVRVTAPGLGERTLTPRKDTHRPRRDAEEPLPLEIP